MAMRLTGDFASQLADQHFGNGQPGGVLDHHLPLADAVREQGDARLVAVDHATEGEAATGARGQHVTVDKARVPFVGNFAQPDLIAHAAKTRSLGAGTIVGSGTIANAEKNITAINDFIHHHEQQENLALQRREQQLNQAKEERERRAAEDYNDRFNRITLVIALIAIFGVIPSFWVDFGGDTNRTAISELLHLDAELSFIVLILISVIMMLFSVGWYYYEFHRRRK